MPISGARTQGGCAILVLGVFQDLTGQRLGLFQTEVSFNHIILKDLKLCVKKIESGYRDAQDLDVCRASVIVAPLLLRTHSKGKNPNRPHLAAPLLVL